MTGTPVQGQPASEPPPDALPTGMVMFLFTDVEGSTSAWERHPEAMRTALARHDALIEQEVEQHRGKVVRPRGEGDSRFAVFGRASDAVAGACAIQRALIHERRTVRTMGSRGPARIVSSRPGCRPNVHITA